MVYISQQTLSQNKFILYRATSVLVIKYDIATGLIIWINTNMQVLHYFKQQGKSFSKNGLLDHISTYPT